MSMNHTSGYWIFSSEGRPGPQGGCLGARRSQSQMKKPPRHQGITGTNAADGQADLVIQFPIDVS